MTDRGERSEPMDGSPGRTKVEVMLPKESYTDISIGNITARIGKGAARSGQHIGNITDRTIASAKEPISIGNITDRTT